MHTDPRDPGGTAQPTRLVGVPVGVLRGRDQRCGGTVDVERDRRADGVEGRADEHVVDACALRQREGHTGLGRLRVLPVLPRPPVHLVGPVGRDGEGRRAADVLNALVLVDEVGPSHSACLEPADALPRTVRLFPGARFPTGQHGDGEAEPVVDVQRVDGGFGEPDRLVVGECGPVGGGAAEDRGRVGGLHPEDVDASVDADGVLRHHAPPVAVGEDAGCVGDGSGEVDLDPALAEGLQGVHPIDRGHLLGPCRRRDQPLAEDEAHVGGLPLGAGAVRARGVGHEVREQQDVPGFGEAFDELVVEGDAPGPSCLWGVGGGERLQGIGGAGRVHDPPAARLDAREEHEGGQHPRLGEDRGIDEVAVGALRLGEVGGVGAGTVDGVTALLGPARPADLFHGRVDGGGDALRQGLPSLFGGRAVLVDRGDRALGDVPGDGALQQQEPMLEQMLVVLVAEDVSGRRGVHIDPLSPPDGRPFEPSGSWLVPNHNEVGCSRQT